MPNRAGAGGCDNFRQSPFGVAYSADVHARRPTFAGEVVMRYEQKAGIAIAALVLIVATAGSIPASARAATGTYRLVENWAQLPPGTEWGVMTAVGVDAQGNVFAFQRSEPTSKVMVFDARGKYLRTWGEGAFTYPHGLRVLRDGMVWIADRQMQQVLKYDAGGKLLMSLGQKGVAG